MSLPPAPDRPHCTLPLPYSLEGLAPAERDLLVSHARDARDHANKLEILNIVMRVHETLDSLPEWTHWSLWVDETAAPHLGLLWHDARAEEPEWLELQSSQSLELPDGFSLTAAQEETLLEAYQCLLGLSYSGLRTLRTFTLQELSRTDLAHPARHLFPEQRVAIAGFEASLESHAQGISLDAQLPPAAPAPKSPRL